MYNQSVETSKFEVLNPCKYSLRNKHPHKITNLRPPPQIPENHKTHNYLHPSETISQRSRISFKDQTQSLELNCFQGANKVWQLNKPPQAVYQSNYRTPSTTNSVQNHMVQPLKLDTTGLKGEGEHKYSLKNCKKDHSSKVNAQFTYNGVRQMSDQRFKEENTSQQVSTDERPTDQHHSEIGQSNKFSLKHGIKKYSKPEVLLSLNYSDLLGLARSKSNSNLHMYTQPPQRPKNGDFCNISRGNEEGCKCQPKCLWTNKWLNQVGEKANWNEGYRNRSQPEWQQSLKQIERDLPRTQPDHPAFQTPKLKEMMKEVLIAYAQLDAEVGYVQGMNFVAAALVYHSRNSYDALKVFSYIMKDCGYRKLFLGDLSFGRKVAGRLVQDLRRLVYDLYSHLTSENIELELFASSWYFSLCGSFVPLQAMHIFIDKFIKKGFYGINELLLALLLHNKQKLLELEDSHLMLQFSNQKLYESGEGIDWWDLRDRSDRILLSPLQH